MLKKLSVLAAIITALFMACDPQDEPIQDGVSDPVNNDSIATDSIINDSIVSDTIISGPVSIWNDRFDVEKELLAAYAAIKKNCLTSMEVWGEMRSDNIIAAEGATEDISNICMENLSPDNEFCRYDAFYDVINRANKVLLYAPLVVDIDPDYAIIEFKANMAEATAIRSFCYWYLIRTFLDVPYITGYDESGNLKSNTPKATFESILDSLIYDLEETKDYTVLKYATTEQTVSRLTRLSIYAMLADMYLWRGDAEDYDKCIDLCENITVRKAEDYRNLRDDQGNDCKVKYFNGYPLIQDAPVITAGYSYDEIFGRGCSFESLFEFTFDSIKNTIFPLYYQPNDAAQVQALYGIGVDFSSAKGNRVFEQPQDTRYYQNIKKTDSGTWAICKYAYDDLNLNIKSGSIEFESASFRNQEDPNWIVYRYTEVLLFEAEACLMKAMQLPDSDPLQKEYNDKAFQLIDAVNQRSIAADNNDVLPKTLTQIIDYSANTSVYELEDLLYRERRRELMFEGKRWFDLVRIARRDGNEDRLLNYVEMKYTATAVSEVRIKFANPYGWYFPISKDEIEKSNGVLEQNPAYSD